MKRILNLIIFFLVCSSLFAFPDNTEARVELREIITAPAGDVLNTPPRMIEQLSDGSEVSFQVKQQNDAFYMLFINESEGRFPVYSRGTYIIKRDLSDGKFIQIKVFLKNHTECYARIFPMDERAVMDIILYGKKIYKGINLPISFAEALTESFDEIMRATSGMIDWNLIFPDIDYYLYSEKQALANEIRSKLPEINDTDDGAMDADGEYVYIEDLSLQPESEQGFNCSGFVKWVADGIYFSLKNEYMSINSLKNKHIEDRGNRWSRRYEDERDPYFGLDWTRNIASEISAAYNSNDNSYKAADVVDIPWSDYIDNVGYPIEELKLLMYYLAVKEPEYIYLASLNVSWGTEPVLRQHIHTAVLIPMLDRDMVYKDIVFERNNETDSEIIAEEYENAYIHLSRIRLSPGFKLPQLEDTPSLPSGIIFRR